MEQEKIWIVLGTILGTLVSTAVVVVLLFCWKRSQRKIRGFSLRAATPLDDAEFESWRRPSQHTLYSEKYGIRAAQQAIVRDRTVSITFEKELDLFDEHRSSSPVDFVSPMMSPYSSIRKPERTRRKSSIASSIAERNLRKCSVVSSIADRPPTPYSPASTTCEFQRGLLSSPTFNVVHYPSKSEASAFKFEFDPEYSVNQPKSDRWL